MKYYKPKNSKLFINEEERQLNARRLSQYSEESFDCHKDFFYFTHIDPFQRFWHCLGMFVGLFFFSLLFYSWSVWSILFYFLGVFFFYGTGLLSHKYYDDNKGRSIAKYFFQTTPQVIRINLLTLFGGYQKSLQEFIDKYPFTVEAYDLEEIHK